MVHLDPNAQMPERETSRQPEAERLIQAVLERDWEHYLFPASENLTIPPSRKYLGGFFDRALVTHIQPEERKGNTYYPYYVGATDSRPAAMEVITSWFPGLGRVYTIEADQKRRERYLWKITDAERGLDFLHKISPNLYVKQEEAEILIPFLEQRMDRAATPFLLKKDCVRKRSYMKHCRKQNGKR